jgi:hypothetical protein
MVSAGVKRRWKPIKIVILKNLSTKFSTAPYPVENNCNIKNIKNRDCMTAMLWDVNLNVVFLTYLTLLLVATVCFHIFLEIINVLKTMETRVITM